MKIVFDQDKSFLQLEEMNDKMRLTLCGIKSYNKAMMFSVDLDEQQVLEIIEYLLNYKK